MKRFIVLMLALAVATSAFCAKPKVRVERVEPLSWWVGMNMPLQLMVNGAGISTCDVEILPKDCGVAVSAVHKADSHNYLFVDVDVADDAVAGEYTLRFTCGGSSVDVPYTIAERAEGSRERVSFTNADFVYLLRSIVAIVVRHITISKTIRHNKVQIGRAHV